MIELKCLEHLVYFMQSGLLRLSKYDLRFLQNLQTLLSVKNEITSNQVTLFEKVVSKYNRQLQKHNISVETINKLTWQAKIILSDPKFTEAFISINNGSIIFRSPFNKKFVEGFRKIPFNNFVWLKDKKQYECPFSSTALRIIVDASHEYYPVVNYCPVTKTLLNNLVDDFGTTTIWSPTFKCVNGMYLVTGCNPYLAEAIKDIQLSPDPKTISELVSYGVNIDKSVIKDNPTLEFSSNYYPEVDITDLDFLVECLDAIGCDGVFMSSKLGGIHKYRHQIKEKLNPAGIFLDEDAGTLISDRLKNYSKPVLLTFILKNDPMALSSFIKVIKITNSNPITIK